MGWLWSERPCAMLHGMGGSVIADYCNVSRPGKARPPVPMQRPAGNLEPSGVRFRLSSGIVSLAIGLGALALLLVLEADRGWRAALFLPFWIAALGMLQ